MKYALIGTGKTGQAIQNTIAPHDLIAAFNSRNSIEPALLQKADVGIVFVPGHVFETLLPVLMATPVPLVIGTTGYAWPNDLDQQLKAANKRWIIGSNFSLGLNVMNYFAKQMQKTLNLLQNGKIGLEIAEKHHIHKLDAPSGTALFLAKSLGFDPRAIAVEREGDAKGTHTISFTGAYDKIAIMHEAHDRAAFAEGVLLACDRIAGLPSGLHSFEKIVEDIIVQKIKG